VERLKAIFYSFLILLALGGYLYWLRDADFGDTILFYFLAALAALVIIVQSYSLIYDVFHRGVTAALNATDETTTVTEKSDLLKVEGNEVPKR
jgi:hypothetical protein